MLAIARSQVARPRLRSSQPTEGLATVRAQLTRSKEINRRGTTILLVDPTLEVRDPSHRRTWLDQGLSAVLGHAGVEIGARHRSGPGV